MAAAAAVVVAEVSLAAVAVDVVAVMVPVATSKSTKTPNHDLRQPALSFHHSIETHSSVFAVVVDFVVVCSV